MWFSSGAVLETRTGKFHCAMTAEDVVLTDTLPSNTDWLTDSSGFDANLGTGVVTWYVGPVAAALDPGSNLMLVGHLPFMERLTAFLITGSFEKPVFKFQNSGIVCLDKDPATESWVIKWTLMPHIG